MISKQSQHNHIFESVRQQIQKGTYPTGSLLPSENEMCAQFGTTRMTVRQALSELVRQGYIERQQGRGSIVKSERQALGLLSFRGFSEVVKESNHDVRTIFMEPPGQSSWPKLFLRELSQQEIEGGCQLLHRLRFADDHPVMHEYTYIPLKGFEELFTEELQGGSLFKTLSTRFGIEMRNVEQSLQAIRANTVHAKALNCPKGSPLLYIKRRYITNKEGLFIYSELYCYTDLYTISNIF